MKKDDMRKEMIKVYEHHIHRCKSYIKTYKKNLLYAQNELDKLTKG